MGRIPEFFQPKIVRDGQMLKWRDFTLDKSGHEVVMALEAYIPPDLADVAVISIEKAERERLRRTAWQAVWLMAQKDWKP